MLSVAQRPVSLVRTRPPLARQGQPHALAGRAVEAQAGQARRRGARQQDRPHRLEADDQRRGLPAGALPGSSPRRGDKGRALTAGTSAEAQGQAQRVPATELARDEEMVRSLDQRTRDTPRGPSVPRHRYHVWNPRCANHLGQRPQTPHRQAGHMDASDPVETNFPLLQTGGRPHMDPGSRPG